MDPCAVVFRFANKVTRKVLCCVIFGSQLNGTNPICAARTGCIFFIAERVRLEEGY